MEDYKAQYYNEALMHYGVKGMKWGVRRKRATKAIKKAAKATKDYAKEYGKAYANNYMHPLMTNKALKNRNAYRKRNNVKGVFLTTKDFKAINKDVRSQKLAKKKKNSKSKVRKGLKAAANYTKAYHQLQTNKLLHPIRTKVAKINAHAGRDTSLSTKEMNAINDAVKARGIKMKALKAKKRRQKQAKKKR